MARPTLITDELCEQVRPLVASGLSFEAVAARLGIGRRTLFDWLARGEADDPPEADALFVRFAAAVREGEAELEATMLASITGDSGKRGEHGRFAWVLERRFPTRWGSKQRVEHSGPEGGPIQVDAGKVLASLARLAGDGSADSDADEPET